MKDVEYTLTLDSAQCHELLKAVELLMRLKIGQYQELIYTLCDIKDTNQMERWAVVDSMFKRTFEVMNKEKKSTDYKDAEWYRLYNLYQVIRKNIHDAEHPEGTGLDASEPMQMTKEPLPKMRWTNE